MIIVCPQCGSENEARRRFCGSCGGGLELLCAACGFSNRVGDRYCGGCGVRLERLLSAAPAAAAVPAGVAAAPSLEEAKRDELRTITVMMADLDGFAEMTDVYGRERQTQIMNEVFERLAETHIVAEFDGYIDKFLDGDIMALFGAPIAHEDAPERALRAAVRMHHELAQLHAEGIVPADTPLRLRIGLNTGPVRVGGVGAGGRMEYTAMGDTVNLAARLMTACAWGGSLISNNTHRRVAGSFELEALEPVRVKGKAEPVEIWSVVAEKRRAARVELAEVAGMSRLVGRDELLRQLFDAFERARAGQGGVVGIQGEAGVGKSRLVYELQKQVESSAALFLEGRCVSYGRDISFLPVREVLSEQFGLEDTDSAAERRARIDHWLAEHDLDVAEQGPAVGFIVVGENPDDTDFNQLDPQSLQARLREATCEVLRAVCATRPLVLFIDDLQWCDADSLMLLEEVVTRCADLALLLVLAYRPDFVPAWLEAAPVLVIEPSRLSLEETRAMVGSLLRQRGLIEDEARIDDTLAQAVHHKSQGNPFFVDQTVTALVERSEQTERPAIDFRRGRLLITEEELGDLVPDSVEEILLARIDRLPESARSLLQAAAVAMIGRYFRRSALEYCRPDSDLNEALELLGDRELIRLERQTADDTEYVFEHVLTRDVAYNNLLRAERRQLHSRVGEYIEVHYATSLNAYLDDLSYHFYNSEQAERALHYLPQSADRAARAFSNQQAILHYKRALEKSEELGRSRPGEELLRQRLTVLKGLTIVQALVSDRETLEYCEQRLALAEQLADRDAVIDASYMLASVHTSLEQFHEAEQAWEQVGAEYEAIGSAEGVRDTAFGLGNLFYLQGRYDRALEYFERARQIQVEQLDFEPFGQWVAYNNLAAAYEAMGRYEEVLDACQSCEELIDQLPADDPFRKRLEGYTAGNFGSAHRNLGNFQEAVEAYQRTMQLAVETGEKALEAEVRHFLGRALAPLGRFPEARAHLDEAIALANEAGAQVWAVRSWAALGEMCLLEDALDQAAECLQQAEALHDGESAWAAEVGLLRGECRRAEGRYDEAVSQLTAVLGQALEAQNGVEEVQALASLAEAERALEPASEMLADHLEQALGLARRMGLRPVLCRLLCSRAQVWRERRPEEARTAVDEAVELAGALAAPLLEIAAQGLRAELRAAADPPGAAADLAAAEARLGVLAELAGTPLAEALARRHLAAARILLADS